MVIDTVTIINTKSNSKLKIGDTVRVTIHYKDLVEKLVKDGESRDEAKANAAWMTNSSSELIELKRLSNVNGAISEYAVIRLVTGKRQYIEAKYIQKI